MNKDKIYLGDGVYARMEGRNLWLTTEDYGTNQICLEPQVWEALIAYVTRMHHCERRSMQDGSEDTAA